MKKQQLSISRKRQIKRKRNKVVLKPLTNYEIIDLVTKLKIPYFDGVFMRDELTKKKKKKKKNDLTSSSECWILNHGSSRTNGTHWTALARFHNMAFYFDSFGKLPPPFEVIDYLDSNIKLYYNVKQYQNYGSSICGHLCLRFLYDFWRNKMK